MKRPLLALIAFAVLCSVTTSADAGILRCMLQRLRPAQVTCAPAPSQPELHTVKTFTPIPDPISTPPGYDIASSD